MYLRHVQLGMTIISNHCDQKLVRYVTETALVFFKVQY